MNSLLVSALAAVAVAQIETDQQSLAALTPTVRQHLLTGYLVQAAIAPGYGRCKTISNEPNDGWTDEPNDDWNERTSVRLWFVPDVQYNSRWQSKIDLVKRSNFELEHDEPKKQDHNRRRIRKLPGLFLRVQWSTLASLWRLLQAQSLHHWSPAWLVSNATPPLESDGNESPQWRCKHLPAPEFYSRLDNRLSCVMQQWWRWQERKRMQRTSQLWVLFVGA